MIDLILLRGRVLLVVLLCTSVLSHGTGIVLSWSAKTEPIWSVDVEKGVVLTWSSRRHLGTLLLLDVLLRLTL